MTEFAILIVSSDNATVDDRPNLEATASRRPRRRRDRAESRRRRSLRGRSARARSRRRSGITGRPARRARPPELAGQLARYPSFRPTLGFPPARRLLGPQSTRRLLRWRRSRLLSARVQRRRRLTTGAGVRSARPRHLRLQRVAGESGRRPAATSRRTPRSSPTRYASSWTRSSSRRGQSRLHCWGSHSATGSRRKGRCPSRTSCTSLSRTPAGLWTGPSGIPHPVALVAPFLPTRQWGDVLWSSAHGGWGGAHWLPLLGFSVAFAALAVAGYRRDEGRRFR